MRDKFYPIRLVILTAFVILLGGCSKPVPAEPLETPETGVEAVQPADNGAELYRAELINQLTIPVGQRVALESLRQAVVPPYVNLLPFIEVPDGIVVEAQFALEEDGVHGSIYYLQAVEAVDGEIVIGFRDLQSDEITHRKVIRVTAE